MHLDNLPPSKGNWPATWLIPDWPVAAHVRAVCSSRAGGTSQGAYDSCNLGLHVGDDADAVQSNRQALARHIGARPVFLNQVHGVELVQLHAAIADGQCADGAFTREVDLACTVMVADCLPVLFCDSAGTQVAAVHAGWRGLLGHQGQGVLETAVQTLRGSQPLLAWLGPCIGPRKFEVGAEVREAFVQVNASAEPYFYARGAGKWLADLPGLARLRLSALGGISAHGNDGTDAWCTVTQASRFFSHRRDRVSGRMAACIWLDRA